MFKFKIGIYNIEINHDKKSLIWIDDGWFSQSIIFYDKKENEPQKWACDFPEKLLKYIKDFLNTVTID